MEIVIGTCPHRDAVLFYAKHFEKGESRKKKRLEEDFPRTEAAVVVGIIDGTELTWSYAVNRL